MSLALARIEGELKHLAARLDVADVRGAIKAVEASIAWQMAALFILQMGALDAIVKLL